MPPLRERVDDVVLIAIRFIDELARHEGASKQLGPDALRQLAS